MTIGGHDPALIDVSKTAHIWDRKEEDAPNAEVDMTVEDSLSYKEGRCLT